jgi:hypothetical protein
LAIPSPKTSAIQERQAGGVGGRTRRTPLRRGPEPGYASWGHLLPSMGTWFRCSSGNAAPRRSRQGLADPRQTEKQPPSHLVGGSAVVGTSGRQNGVAEEARTRGGEAGRAARAPMRRCCSSGTAAAPSCGGTGTGATDRQPRRPVPCSGRSSGGRGPRPSPQPASPPRPGAAWHPAPGPRAPG